MQMSGDIFGCHHWEVLRAFVGEDQGCCKHPTTYRTAPAIANCLALMEYYAATKKKESLPSART